MRIKCQYNGKVILYGKNDEILMEEELPFNENYEPKDYIINYLNTHKINHLGDFKIDFHFKPLFNENFTFIDCNLGDYYLFPFFNGSREKNVIDIDKDFYVVEKIHNDLVPISYKLRYAYSKYERTSMLVFYLYDDRYDKYSEVLTIGLPMETILTDIELDNKIITFCNLISSNIQTKLTTKGI